MNEKDDEKFIAYEYLMKFDSLSHISMFHTNGICQKEKFNKVEDYDAKKG